MLVIDSGDDLLHHVDGGYAWEEEFAEDTIRKVDVLEERRKEVAG
jgi:hypothetical protein